MILLLDGRSVVSGLGSGVGLSVESGTNGSGDEVSGSGVGDGTTTGSSGCNGDSEGLKEGVGLGEGVSEGCTEVSDGCGLGSVGWGDGSNVGVCDSDGCGSGLAVRLGVGLGSIGHTSFQEIIDPSQQLIFGGIAGH
jgi:hypothetical protein